MFKLYYATRFIFILMTLSLSLVTANPLPAETTGQGGTEYVDEEIINRNSSSKVPTQYEPEKKLFKFKADFRFREAYQGNIKSLNSDLPASDWFMQRYRLRGQFTFSPSKDVDINSRVVWEFRHYHGSELEQTLDWSYGLFDKLNVTWRNVLDLPLTITAGRQDIKLDSGWLVSDGTPGQRTDGQV